MNSPVTKIKERLSIEEVVSSYIKLEKTGANLKARCPFHNEKTASFFISPDRGTYYCFGCQASGDIFSFVEEFEGLDFKGALKMLAIRAGVNLTEFKEEKEGEKERLYRIMEEASLFFQNNLLENKEALSYLKNRGLEDKTIKDFAIGFAFLDWRRLHDYLKTKGFSVAEMEKAGLVKKSEKSLPGSEDGYYDRFRGRIMFPISDSSGRVIAFSGRILVDDEKSAKYLNSPDTPIFKKSSILYGLDKAKSSIRKNDFSIVVEGQFDLILSHQAGFKNTVATSGTALVGNDKNENEVINNLGIVSRLSQNIIFIFDSDKAGLNASIRATPIAMALFSDMNVKATEVGAGKDPADLISKEGKEAWQKVIRNSKHIIEFLLDKFILNEKDKDSLKMKLEIDNKIIPYLTYISNPIKKSHFISLISNKSGISEEDIRMKIKKVEQDLRNEKAEIEKVKEIEKIFLRKDNILRKLLGVAFWQENIGNKDIDAPKVIQDVSEVLKIDEKILLEKVKDQKEDLIFEAEVFYNGNEDIKKDVAEMLDNLKEEYLKEDLANKMRELHQAEGNKEKEKALQILKEINEINNKIQSIKNGRISKKIN